MGFIGGLVKGIATIAVSSIISISTMIKRIDIAIRTAVVVGIIGMVGIAGSG